MTTDAFQCIMHTIAAEPAESGGLLLGPKDTDLVSLFVLDEGSACTGATYRPDHQTLNRRLRDEWQPAGLAFKGFIHSHPAGFITLSQGDLIYIRRIFEANPSMKSFLAPIVLPEQFWIRPFIVHRDPVTVEEAALNLLSPRPLPPPSPLP